MFGCDGNLAAGAEVNEGLRRDVLDGFGLLDASGLSPAGRLPEFGAAEELNVSLLG